MSFYSDLQYKAGNDLIYYNMFFEPNVKLLDIGSGIGNLLINASKDSVGIDIDEDEIKIARNRGLNIIRHDIEKGLPFDDETFDAVNCKQLLEHIKNYPLLIKEIFRILKPKGKLVIFTDAPADLFEFWDELEHVRPYTKRSLEKLAYYGGFRNYRAYYFANHVFGLSFAYRHKILSIKTVKKITRLVGFFKKNRVVLEAIK